MCYAEPHISPPESGNLNGSRVTLQDKTMIPATATTNLSTTPQKAVFVKTFGCQMNVYDSERMSEALAGDGYTATDDIAAADLVILNTCHIREKAAEKVYSDLGRIRQIKEARQKSGKSTIVAVT